MPSAQLQAPSLLPSTQPPAQLLTTLSGSKRLTPRSPPAGGAPWASVPAPAYVSGWFCVQGQED